MEKTAENKHDNKNKDKQKYVCKEIDIKGFKDDKFKFICPSCGFRWNE